jgi:hypothetical protein
MKFGFSCGPGVATPLSLFYDDPLRTAWDGHEQPCDGDITLSLIRVAPMNT